MRMPFRYWLCLIVSIASFSSSRLSATELHVFAAASLSDVLNEIGSTYSKQTGIQLEFNFAGSGILARQIAEGAPADLFFSADEPKMDAIGSKGLLLPGSRMGIISNSLVVIRPLNNPLNLKTANDLTRLHNLAMGEPDSVPAGSYAREFLTHIGLWEELKGRVIPMENVRATLSVVEGGNAEAGIVYKTDAVSSEKVAIAFEIQSAPRIIYPMAILAATKAPQESATFESYLQSPEAIAVFRKYGFLAIPKKE